MHKAEISDENDELKHYLQSYDQYMKRCKMGIHAWIFTNCIFVLLKTS